MRNGLANHDGLIPVSDQKSIGGIGPCVKERLRRRSGVGNKVWCKVVRRPTSSGKDRGKADEILLKKVMTPEMGIFTGSLEL